MRRLLFCCATLLLLLAPQTATAQDTRTDAPPLNVLFIISDDLTAEALSCYGNEVSQTPHIDALAAQGTRFTRTYCQFPVCGPSRASFMNGYYPHATGVHGYTSGREGIGDRATWAELFKDHGYYTARVSKIFHMGVPGGIEQGGDGADDPRSWTQRFNSQGPEWRAPGEGELLENNPNRDRPQQGGNNFAYVIADGDDLVHSDGRTAHKACELIEQRAHAGEPFFLAVGFVRPHVPFVAPARFYEPYPFDEMTLPGGDQPWHETPDDWDDIPQAGINYRTSLNMKMDLEQRRAAVGAYYASVAFVDELVGQIVGKLEEQGLADNTLVIFTSDHGFHLGEHDFWAKVSLHEESARVPLIIRYPGKAPGVCDSFTELLDLYPTIAAACGLETSEHLQGHNILPMLDDPSYAVRDTAFCVNGRNNGFLLRDDRWAYIQYGEQAGKGIELYDMHADPQQLTNLAPRPEYADVVAEFRQRLADKLAEVRDNDLGE
ncbi:MAG: sulfatase [Phycisphaerales bacterium JB063]